MEKLIQLAKEAAQMAYVPYSKFKVGCAVEMNDGVIVKGANIENASYGATCCAERAAFACATMKGYKPQDVNRIAVYNSSEKMISPCGICRQVLRELAPLKTIVIMINGKMETREATVEQLLPYSFGGEFLDV